MARPPATLLAGLLVLALATSGCLAGESSVFGPGSNGGTATGTNEAGNGLALAMQAVPARGSAPLEVEFTLKAVAAAAGVPWTLSFGDGTRNQTGNGLPVDVEHIYTKPGVYNATFIVEDPSGLSRASLTINVAPGRAPSSSTGPSSTSAAPSPTTSPAPPPPPPPPPPPASSTSTSETSTSSTSSSSTSESETATQTTTESSSSSTSETSSSTSQTDTSTDTSTAAPPSSSSSTSDTGTSSQTSTTSDTQSTTSDTGTTSDEPQA